MKTSLKNFLDDLYAIDPSLKTHEAEIIPLVEKLLASDPAQEPDSDFVKRLRMELQERGAQLSGAGATSGWQKWLFALGGAVTAAVILPVAFVALNNSKTPAFRQPQDGEAIFGYSISEARSKAFGPLVGMTEGTSARGQGGGGGDASTAVPPAQPSIAAGEAVTSDMAVGSDAKMIAPWPMYQYEYNYTGEIKGLQPTVAVYKRDTTRKSIPLSALGSSLNLGNLDLGSFGNMNMDSVTFSQNVDYGYQITVNLRDSSVYLDAQWDKWPMSKCQTEACFQAERVRITDIPSEDSLIAIAQDFVKDHNIDMSHYGTPEVNMLWKRDYDRAPNKNDVWIPDTIQVTYPLMIDGNKVHDQGGQPFGIVVGVHVKSRRVMNVYGIMSRNYLKSDYDGVTDQQQIKDYISRVDNYGPIIMERGEDQPEMKTMTVTLGEPVRGYSVYYKYDMTTSQELLVPALIFPVTNVSGGVDSPYMYYRSAVVVPLAADMLKEQMNQGQPMPVDLVR